MRRKRRIRALINAVRSVTRPKRFPVSGAWAYSKSISGFGKLRKKTADAIRRKRRDETDSVHLRNYIKRTYNLNKKTGGRLRYPN